jgi:pimeloyl-ACP methyl ester carboxylesterase
MTPEPPVRHVIYLHGFASSPGSSKAQRFKRELEARNIGFSCPDFNEPAFETLTTTRMLHHTIAAIDDVASGPIALIGSSLGAFVAVLAVAQMRSGGVSNESARDAAARKVDRLILLAPALDFGGNRLRQFGEYGIDEWRRAGRIRMFHYAYNEPREIGFELYEDAARYDAFDVSFDQPALLFQGTRDDTVDPAMVERWSRSRANVELHLLDDDHQLTASMDVIWPACARFLGV